MALRNYGLIESIDTLRNFVSRCLDGDGPIGFDIETGYLGEDKEKHSLHPETAIIAGISFTVSTDWARYVPLGHDTGENLDNREAARLFWQLLSTGRGVAHNASFELRHLARWFRDQLSDDPEYGQAVRDAHGYFPVRSDTMVEAYLAAEYPFFGLKPLVEALFGHKMTELHELFPGLAKNRRKMLRFNVLDQHDAKVFEYACEDSVWCLAIHQRYYERVSQMQVTDCPCHPPTTNGLLYKTEMAILDVNSEMEDFGVAYDWNLMRCTGDTLLEFQDRFNAEIMAGLSEMVGAPTTINLGSPAQVGDTLYGKLGLKTNVYTAKTRDLPASQRKMSTGKIALERLAKQYPVVRQITEWKEMRKLRGTYLDKYENQYNYAPDGRTHPNHLSAFVITGRYAVSDPPYQQSPKVYHFDLAEAAAVHAAHTEAHGKDCGKGGDCAQGDPRWTPPAGTCFRFNFRDSIVAPPDHYVLGFDLSQAELRAIAGEAKETALLEAFAAGQDVHTLTAALMLRIPVDEITKDQRSIGKTMNFALLYGMGFKSLGDRLGIPAEEAEALYNKYFQVYSGIAAWSDKQVQHGKTYGYVVSRFGRRLPIWEYQSDNPYIRSKGDRACVNYPIQGSATGDYTKIAMVRARNALRAAGLADKVHLVMNIHDALEFYVHRSVEPQHVIAVLKPAVTIAVPGWPQIAIDWHLGRSWGSVKEIAVADDGTITIKGTQEEIRPTIEVDEETGEEVVVLPFVDDEVVKQAIEATRYPDEQPALDDAEPADARRLRITIDEMPSEHGWVRFVQLLGQRPGPHTIVMTTPEGDLKLPQTTDLGVGDLGEISLLLGPARVGFDDVEVDGAQMLADLTF